MKNSELNILCEIVPVMGCIASTDGYFKYLNPEWEQTLGYSMQELLSKPFFDFIHPEDREATQREIEKQLNGSKIWGFENRYRCKDGSYKVLEWSPVSAGDDRLLAVARDITERKRIEKSLIQTETRQRILMDTLPDLVWLKDPNGVYLSCNRTFERFFGAKESTIIGKTDYDFADRDLADFFRENDRKAMEAGQPSMNEEILRFAEDGYQGLFETIKTPMYDGDGNLIGVLGIARDVSKRKKAERELRENEQRYKIAQRMGKVGNWEYDLMTGTFCGSEQAKRIYGLDLYSETFTTDEFGSCILERERVHQALLDLIERNKPYDLEFEILPITGPPQKTIKSIAEVVCDENGVPQKVIGVIQDITQQIRDHKERIELEKRLKQAEKMESIGTLAGGIAHDFNNILGAILGYAEMARDDCDSQSTTAKKMGQVIQAGHRAKELVKQILAFSRQTESQQIPLQPAIIVKESIKLLRSSLPTTITIEHDIAPNTKSILADPTQIHQIIINLSTNAFHAMAETGGTLTISLKNITFSQQDPASIPSRIPGDFVQLSIADTGQGIAREIRERIFDPYFTTKETGKGTGLGLSIVHGIVKSCDGFITCDSLVGKGTVFHIFLPALERENIPDKKPIEIPPIGVERILFVDDESMIVEIFQEMLSRLGYFVTGQTSSLEALNAFENQPDSFDLVITDQTMPGMTGIDLSLRILQIRPEMPIILCTGYSDLVSEEKIASLGISGFATKPLGMQEFSDKIRNLLDRKSSES